MRRKILIAHYDKSLSWVEELNTDANIIIYSTNKNMTNEVINGIKINVISPNKGIDSIMHFLQLPPEQYEDFFDLSKVVSYDSMKQEAPSFMKG